jgi:1,4-alpha-glucan branching enzyme
MEKASQSIVIDRGIALHKMIRLFTLTTSGAGYLNFMGNEFGHPEWIDFPREGNHWSYQYARRQWHLADNVHLKYQFLLDFDKAMLTWASSADCFDVSFPNQLFSSDADQIIAYQRKNWIFVFNFNPVKSFEGYQIPTQAGKYHIVLSTDDIEFGGQNRIDKSMIYFSTNNGQITTVKTNYLQLYLPVRTAVVFRLVPTKSVY